MSNLVGGYLVGVAVAVFAHQPGWSPEWRLFVIAGFLGGGLTTFSTFSAEVVALLQQGRVSGRGPEGMRTCDPHDDPSRRVFCGMAFEQVNPPLTLTTLEDENPARVESFRLKVDSASIGELLRLNSLWFRQPSVSAPIQI